MNIFVAIIIFLLKVKIFDACICRGTKESRSMPPENGGGGGRLGDAEVNYEAIMVVL